MPRILQLAVIGTAAGLFSGLFGVGGGTIIVPLLIAWLAYGEREATGTSMVSIFVIAVAAVVVQALYGNVSWVDAIVIGLAGTVGALLGTALQQRIPERVVAGMFSVLLLVVAVELVVS
ncbi:MAG: sulfite exporter TauE/SafE family protein [bacterium]